MTGEHHGRRLAVAMFLAAGLVAFLAGPVLAQGAGPDPSPTDFWTWLKASRTAGWVIILLSVAALALSVEYALSLRRSVTAPEELRLALEELLAGGRYDEARAVAADDGSFLGRVMAAGLARCRTSEQAAFAAMEEAGRAETDRLYRKIGYLALIATVAPMIGLFGTVAGMMLSFDQIAASGQPRISQLAGGIRFALVTTYEGLLVAIPTTVIYAVFRNRVARIAAEVAAAAEDLILLAFRVRKGPPTAAGGK